MLFGLGFANVIGLCLALCVSCARVCAGRRGLRVRSWLAVIVVTAVAAVGYIGVNQGQQVGDPVPPRDSCELDMS